TQGNRITEFDSSAAKAFFEKRNTEFLKCSIHDTIKRPPPWADNHTGHVQDLLKTIRTELDKFSAEEVFVLCRHGYLAAQRVCATSAFRIFPDLTTPSEMPWMPGDELQNLGKGELENRLANSHVLRKLNFPWAVSVIALLAFIPCLFTAIGYWLG